jgi:5-formyltetrahydrofolate cyclo-ligase
MTSNNSEHPEYSSPPCFAHELDANGYVVDWPQSIADIACWRKATREVLIAARLAIPASERKQKADDVADVLDGLIDFGSSPTISLYWPFRGELNLRDWMRKAHDRGARIALPIVVAKSQPLVFREWTPECKMEPGIWNIPVPTNTAIVTPTVVISPLVGYDPDCFRLGYGGGFFDRTLATLPPATYVIGVGLPCAAIPSIHPQPHDIPMDVIVTGNEAVFRCLTLPTR